jgi:hypothetical protein
MRAHAPHAAAVRANKHVRMLRWLFNLLPVRNNCQSAITDYFTSYRHRNTPAQTAACSVLDQALVPVPVSPPHTSTPSACLRDCLYFKFFSSSFSF